MLDMILGNWGSWLSSQAAAQNSLQLTPRSGVVSSSSLRGGALYSAGTKFLRMLRLPERILVHDPQATMGSVFTLENVVDVSIQLSGSLLVKGSSNGLLQDRALSERSIRFNTSAGNPVKEILLKLNLLDHRILKDGGEVKEFQERCLIQAFKTMKQQQYDHVGQKSHKFTRWQSLQDGEKRLCLVDDLKKFKITFMITQRYNSMPKVKYHYINSQVNDWS
ncbi:hypothetical protein Tco_0003715 [Tanacetum coccineum]